MYKRVSIKAIRQKVPTGSIKSVGLIQHSNRLDTIEKNLLLPIRCFGTDNKKSGLAIHPAHYPDPKTHSDDLISIFDSAKSWRQHLSPSTSSGFMLKAQLLHPQGFTLWSQQLIKQANYLVHKITELQTESDALNIVKRLDRLSDLLCSLIDLAEFVRSVHPNIRFVREANDAYLSMVSYMNKLNTDPGLYNALKRVLDDKNITSRFTAEELEVATIFLKDFAKSGIHLNSDKRAKFVSLNDDINELGRTFINNGEPMNQAISVDRADMDGCEGWWNGTQHVQLVPTSAGHASMLLRTAHSRDVRRRMYVASNTPSPNQLSTLDGLLSKRAELADLLGHPSFAHLFLADKMASSPESVEGFLDGLTNKLKPAVGKEMGILNELCRRDTKDPSARIEAWDQLYYSHQYELNLRSNQPTRQSNISNYFSVGTVIQGLSDLLHQMYSIRFRPATNVPSGELWDDSVRKLEVINNQNQVIGVIYMDLYARPNKQHNAAHYTVQCSRRLDYDLKEDDMGMETKPYGPSPSTIIRTEEGCVFQIPVVVLSCSFSNPSPASPSLLEPTEVETLFHEMGHAIHSMLARTEFHNVAGTRCKIDFVEFPSIFLESFALSPSIAPHYAKHYQTHQPLPLERLQAYHSNQCLKGLETQHQIMLAMIDQKYHHLSPQQCKGHGFSSDLLPDIVSKYGVCAPVEEAPFAFKFGHLFSYSASYYTYLLGRVLANKMWQNGFQSTNLTNTERIDMFHQSGSVIKDEILRYGGAKDPWQCVSSALEKLNQVQKTPNGQIMHDVEILNQNDPATAMKVVGRWGLPHY